MTGIYVFFFFLGGEGEHGRGGEEERGRLGVGREIDRQTDTEIHRAPKGQGPRQDPSYECLR